MLSIMFNCKSFYKINYITYKVLMHASVSNILLFCTHDIFLYVADVLIII